jgi:hemerythrin
MAILNWVPDLNTGIEEIDRQHRRIVDYINRLYELRETPDRKLLGDVIAETVDYTLSHFAFEEGMLEEAGYMFSGPHKRVHELFIRRVTEIQQRFEAGEDVTNELHGMLSRWLFNHIRNEDRGYVDTVKTYQRMQNKNTKTTEQKMKEEIVKELEAKHQRKGFFARLFS